MWREILVDRTSNVSDVTGLVRFLNEVKLSRDNVLHISTKLLSGFICMFSLTNFFGFYRLQTTVRGPRILCGEDIHNFRHT